VDTDGPAAGLVGGLPFDEILAVSCRRPPARDGVVARDELVKGLIAPTQSAPIVALRAPAGYGKTMLLTLWDDADPRPFAWVHLGPLDDNPVHLLRHVAGALAQAEPLSDRCVRHLTQSGRQIDVDMLPAVLTELEARQPSVLVFDDVHLVHSAEAIECIRSLTTSMPGGSTICLSGRTMDVPIARHREQGHVIDLGAADLAMSVPQAVEVFAHAGLDLDDGTISDLCARTEGWPAGLHLAALALSTRGGATGSEFSGRNRLVGDYLVEEALAGLEPEMVEFLERSSVLTIMSGETLDALLQRSDSRRFLTEIEHSGNLLLVPLDPDGHLFRYHHLFRDLLRARLEARDPAMSSELERRASDVTEAAGDVDEAIRHGVAAGDSGRAARLVLRDAGRLALSEQRDLLRQRLALIGLDSVNEHPEAAVAWAWAGVAEVDRELIVRSLAAATHWPDRGPLSDGSPSLSAAVSFVRCMLGAEGIDGVLRDSTAARQGGPSNPWWGRATLIQGTAYSMLGQFDLAREALEDALLHLTDAPTFEAVGLSHLAFVNLHDHDLGEARRLVDRALGIADRHHLQGVVAAISVYAVGALVAARSGSRDEALKCESITRTMLEHLGRVSPRTAVLSYLALAQTWLALGDPGQARLLAHDAQRARRRDSSATFLNEELDRVMDQLDKAALTAATVIPLTAAEMRVLVLLPSHLSLQEIAGELLISRNTAKSHSVSIYRKLGVTSRSDAVAEARRIGLVS
jgi:LuxR family maltose regulon positive regulatory protein